MLHVQVLLIALVSGFLNGSRPLELIRRHSNILIHVVKIFFFSIFIQAIISVGLQKTGFHIRPENTISARVNLYARFPSKFILLVIIHNVENLIYFLIIIFLL